jgi:hypothetical protein
MRTAITKQVGRWKVGKTMAEHGNFHDTPQHTSPFDAIQQIDEQGNEYWSARDLYKILGYTEWRNFNKTVIGRAIKACEENGREVSDHFVRSYKEIQLGSCKDFQL